MRGKKRKYEGKERKEKKRMARYFGRNRFSASKVAGISYDQPRKRALILGFLMTVPVARLTRDTLVPAWLFKRLYVLRANRAVSLPVCVSLVVCVRALA